PRVPAGHRRGIVGALVAGRGPRCRPRSLRRRDLRPGLVSRLTAEERRARFGPSKGDRIRLGDTNLWIRVEEDRQAPGDQPIWGYAKNLRVGLAQGSDAGPSELDAVVLGAIVIDATIGVVKADIGIKDGRI